MSLFCQLATLKRRLDIATSETADDTILTNAIKAVSARFNKHCNRVFDRTASAIYEFDADLKFILPPCYPVESVASWHLKDNETDGWVAQTGVEYLLRKNGAVLELVTPLGTAAQIAKVTYTGGYVLPGTTPSGSQTALPDDIEQAAVEQCVYWFQNRNRLGITSASGEGASVSQFADLDLLPSVRGALEAHKRIVAF